MNKLLQSIFSILKREPKPTNDLPEYLYFRKVDKLYYGLCGLTIQYVILDYPKFTIGFDRDMNRLAKLGYTRLTKEEYDKFNKD